MIRFLAIWVLTAVLIWKWKYLPNATWDGVRLLGSPCGPGYGERGSLMEQQHEREWVRNHTIAGYVVGRFQGEHEGTRCDLVAVQTWDGARVVPEAALMPIDKD